MFANVINQTIAQRTLPENSSMGMPSAPRSNLRVFGKAVPNAVRPGKASLGRPLFTSIAVTALPTRTTVGRIPDYSLH
jgi:hypothetical protein